MIMLGQSVGCLRHAGALSVALILAACGGSSDQAGAPPVAVGTPTPTQPAAPPPTSTPSPTPTPLPPPLPGVTPGQTIAGTQACSRGTIATDARGHVSAITSLSRAAIDGFGLFYSGVDYTIADRGVIGNTGFAPFFAASDRQPSPVAAYDLYLNPTTGGELLLSRTATNPQLDAVAFGSFGASELCFFAAGRLGGLPTGGEFRLVGLTDGLARIAGDDRRLFGAAATLTVNPAAGTAAARLELAARANPFGAFDGEPATAVGVATGTLTLAAEGRLSGTLTGPGAFAGEVEGDLFASGAGAGLSFTLHNPQGDLIFGIAALDASN